MAVVMHFERSSRHSFRQQPTQVVASYGIFEAGDQKMLQIDTFGSESRREPGKQSQTLQLTETSARELAVILKREFGL